MIDRYKAVFLPVDDRILNLFKGYILNGELLEIDESDVYTITKCYEDDDSISRAERVFRIIVLIPFIPILILAALIAIIFKKFDYVSDKFDCVLNRIESISVVVFSFFDRSKRLQTKRRKNKKYDQAIEENIPDFLNHCKKQFAKVYLYSYCSLTTYEKRQLDNLIESGLITSCKTISKISDLATLIIEEKISLKNSFLVIQKSTELAEAKKLGINTNYQFIKNIELWKKRNFNSKNNLETNSCETLLLMKKDVEFYLKSESNAFLTNDSILFIEDKRDTFLNDYIQKNLKTINRRLIEKKMQLIYFPVFQLESLKTQNPILEFLRYRLPVLYSLTDSELNDAINTVMRKISVEEFYNLVLEELQLPYFKRPCLLRNISGGLTETLNKFTYQHIEYQTEEDLDNLFDQYLNQVSIPNDYEHMRFKLQDPPSDYDADWHFGNESKQDTEDLKFKIDEIKAQGKFGVLAEAIMYMLETIKDEKPELLMKVRPFIERKKLLESAVVLSPILIDKHYNIFLPDFGNIEVKMHALPKTVYIFFLRYPKGIRFKELYQHKAELLEIYNKLTNKYEKVEIERAILDLVDMTKPNINMQCSRIRASFRNLMDEHIAKHYYIDGLNGEAKMISLPKKLIDIRY